MGLAAADGCDRLPHGHRRLVRIVDLDGCGLCGDIAARGIGIALLLWFYFALIYDGLITLVLFNFSDYPLERFVVPMVSLNPIDLGRIYLMLQMDVSAMMGHTGAYYKDFFGSSGGMLYTLVVMLIWICTPLLIAMRWFNRKDL